MKTDFIVFLIIFFLSFFSKVSYLIDSTYDTFSSDIISKQESVDKKIDKYINKGYKIDDAKVIVNPYYLSPLTGLAIFRNYSQDEIKFYLNDELYYTTSEYNISVPIYDLKAGYNNELKICDSKCYKYYLKTKSIDTNIDVKVTSNDSYLLSSSTSDLDYSIVDGEGNLRWKLDINSQGMIYPIEDDKFLVGVEEYTDDDLNDFQGLYLMNYLGKIINRYDNKFGYHHDVYVIDSKTALVLGDSDNNLFSIVYKLDLETGKIIDYIDVSEILKSVDKDFVYTELNLNYGYGTNSIDFDGGNILLSFRCLNLIMSINYENKTINWMYSNDKIFNNFNDYMLTGLKEYPVGSHDARFTDNGFTFYNNDYDILNNSSLKVKDFKKNKAKAIEIKVDGKKGSIVNEYTSNKFSYAFGSFSDSSLVNYSYIFKNNKGSILDYEDKTYSEVVEYDKDNKIKYNAIFDDRIFRVIKFDLPKVTNYKSYVYKYYSDYDVSEVNIKNALKGNKDIITFYDNYYQVYLEEANKQDFKVIFKKYFSTIVINYNGKKTYYNLPKGKYKIYYTYNGKYYYYGKMIKR